MSMEKILTVRGLVNWQSARVLTQTLEDIDGISNVNVDLEEMSVILEMARGIITDDELCVIVDEAGFEVIEIE